MATVRVSWGRKLRVLDFDCENRPLTYGGRDFTFSDITGIAWAWLDDGIVQHELLYPGQNGIDITRFIEAYRQAGMVTCHNLIRHDLPEIGGRLLELGLPPLPPMLVHDTWAHLKKRQGISASQESLAEMLGIEAPKIGMSQMKWRLANRLLPEGLAKTRERVVGDVIQHQALRNRLLELGWLRPARVWQP